jgi:hypothetical protein
MHTIQYLLSQVGDGTWQDVMLSAGNIFFCVTLIPMLRQPGRPPLLTCLPTGLALIAGGFVFASLHLWLTALTQTITGLQWLALVLKHSSKATSVSPNRSEAPFEIFRLGLLAMMMRHLWSHAQQRSKCPAAGLSNWLRPASDRWLKTRPPSQELPA